MELEQKIKVAVLGATGTVGQKFITLLENHPFFEILEVVASKRSAGKLYKQAVNWKQTTAIPQNIAEKTVLSLEDSLSSTILFSGLDSKVAGEAEENYASLGHIVISNSKNHRMDSNVPLVIPEINPDHLKLIEKQPYFEKGGAIITNPNCSVMAFALPLAPLFRTFGIEWLQVTTMQAISGAGYPGVSSLDILGNVVPYIGDEEDKLETEPQKILGKLNLQEGKIEHLSFPVTAQCNRVPVFDGHTETLSIKFKKKTTPEEVKKALLDFKGYPQQKNLPSAPKNPIILFEEEDRPQPTKDILRGGGMSSCVGRIRECPVGDIKMVVMQHNTIRGAAGAAILNAETLFSMGYFDGRF